MLAFASFGLALAILVLSLLPGGERLPTTGWDKGNHALAFLMLSALALHAFPGRVFRVALAAVGWGALIEVVQGMTTYRQAEWGDLLADAVGVAAGLAVVLIWRRLRAR